MTQVQFGGAKIRSQSTFYTVYSRYAAAAQAMRFFEIYHVASARAENTRVGTPFPIPPKGHLTDRNAKENNHKRYNDLKFSRKGNCLSHRQRKGCHKRDFRGPRVHGATFSINRLA